MKQTDSNVIDELMKCEFLGDRDPEFKAFVEQMPPTHWAKYDISAVRLGWEAFKRLHADGLRRKAPWPDFLGNELFEGDRIIHPDGLIGRIFVGISRDHDGDKWLVMYDIGIARLCLQIGDKGQAIKLLEE